MENHQLFYCLNCQTPLRIDVPIKRSDSLDSDKYKEFDVNDSLSGESKNLMRLLSDAQLPSNAPICKDCSDKLLSGMDSQLEYLERECIDYKTALNFLKENHPSSCIGELKTQLQNLDDEERSLEEKLRKLTIEENQVDQELKKKRREYESCDNSKQLWMKYRDNLRHLLEDDDEVKKLECEVKYAEQQYRKLCDTNILDLCFHIWKDDNFGLINGFRLGYIKDAKESKTGYNEINAALGQVILLVDILFERLGIQHPELIPVAMGSHSYIKWRTNGIDRDKYLMYGQGTPFVGSTPLDAGMKRLMELLMFMQKELEKKNRKFRIPYEMFSEGFIDEGMKYKALMNLNIDVRWTRAMLMMLINLKASVAECVVLRPPA